MQKWILITVGIAQHLQHFKFRTDGRTSCVIVRPSSLKREPIRGDTHLSTLVFPIMKRVPCTCKQVTEHIEKFIIQLTAYHPRVARPSRIPQPVSFNFDRRINKPRESPPFNITRKKGQRSAKETQGSGREGTISTVGLRFIDQSPFLER